MRLFEVLLLLANLFTLFAWAPSRHDVARWMHYSAPIALLITIAQMLVEGLRWPMIPAYALTGILLLVWLRRNITPAERRAGQKRSHRLVLGLGVLGLAVSVALPMGLPVFSFPPPSGLNDIGTLTYHWVDAGRPEIFTADPNDHRELMVQIWYPAMTASASPRAPYVQDAHALAAALARLKHLPTLFFGQWKYVTTNAVTSAPVADDHPNYPVLIFLEGAIGFRQMNTFQVEDLVSHGYIVVAIDHQTDRRTAGALHHQSLLVGVLRLAPEGLPGNAA